MSKKKTQRKKKKPKEKGIYLALRRGKERPRKIKREKAESKKYRQTLTALWFYTGKGGADKARKLIKAGKLKPVFQAVLVKQREQYKPKKAMAAPKINLNGKVTEALQAAKDALEASDSLEYINKPGKIRKQRKAAIGMVAEALELI